MKSLLIVTQNLWPTFEVKSKGQGQSYRMTDVDTLLSIEEHHIHSSSLTLSAPGPFFGQVQKFFLGNL